MPASRKFAQLRYPVTFGMIFLGVGVAFFNRLNIIGDLEEKRKVLHANEDREGAKMLRDFMKST